MDPVSAVSLAAGAVQFADVGIRTMVRMIKLLESLKHTPQRMAELLEDLDRSVMRLHAIQKVIQQPDSPLLAAPGMQYRRLLKSISSACETILDLQRLFEPLFGASSNSAYTWAKGTWRSVVSLILESRIAAKIERLGRLNEELMGEMLLVGTEMQGRLDTMMLQTQKSLAVVQDDLKSQKDSFQLSYDAVQQMRLQFESQLVNIQTQIQNSIHGLQSELALNSTRTVHQIHHIQNGIEASIQATIRKESLETKAEMAQLRQTILELLGGVRIPGAVEMLNDFQLGQSGDAQVTNQVGKQLATSPSWLREVCDTLIMSEPSSHSDTRKDLAQGAKIGGSIVLRQNLIRRIGPFGVTYNSADTGKSQSWRKQSNRGSCRVSFFAQLLPILKKTVEVTFAASFGAGGNSIAASLRYYGTIQRSRSPIFQAIDAFPSRCARRVYENEQSFDTIWHTRSRYRLTDDTKYEFFVLDWDLDLLDVEVPRLCQEISNHLITDYQAASCSDENGYTPLHALMFMCGLLGVDAEKFSQDFETLAHRLIAAGVAVNATCHGSAREYSIDFDDNFLAQTSTALGFSVKVALSYGGPIVPLPLKNIVLGILEEEDPVETPITCVRCFSEAVTLHVKTTFLKLFRSYPQILPYFGYGLFERAILNRWDSRLRSLLEDDMTRTQILETDYFRRVSPADMAIGWPTGIKILGDSGFELDGALELAIGIKDLESTNFILAADCFPRKGESWRRVLGLLKLSNREIQSVVICELARRRRALAKLAIDHLTTKQVLKLGPLVGQALDTSTPDVLRELQTRGVGVPLTLLPASRLIRHYDDIPVEYVPIYFALFSDNGFNYADKDLLQLAYDNGFISIDACERYNKTPLFLACQFHRSGHESLDQSIHWLLHKGADTRFKCRNDTPNILFSLAREYGRVIRHGLSPQSWDIKGIINHVLLRSECQSLDTDGCICYCSDQGCSTLYRLWTCYKLQTDHQLCSGTNTQALLVAVNGWTQMCELDDDQALPSYEQAMKLEVFERLGMTHTCFQGRHQTDMDVWALSMEERATLLEKWTMSERAQLRDESQALKTQLDLIILGYSKRFKSHVGALSSFWAAAMLDLSHMLPDPPPEERCRNRCLSSMKFWRSQRTPEFSRQEEERHNSMLEAQANLLKQNGYEGWDFIDVIRHHFRDCFDDGMIRR